MTRQALFGWRRQFERRGIDAVAYGYPSREPFSDNSKRLARLSPANPRRRFSCWATAWADF